MASYRIEFARSAEKDLRKIAKKEIPRILRAVEALADEPRPSGAKKLTGSERTYRIRTGGYRVVYEVEDGILVVLVVRIASRGDAYRKKS